jgi:hypothetical protein
MDPKLLVDLNAERAARQIEESQEGGPAVHD